MNNISSIKKAINCLPENNIALLHTTNLYPTPHEYVRLSAMVDLHENFPNYVYGLSDHTTDSTLDWSCGSRSINYRKALHR